MATRTRTVETYQNGTLVNSRTETYDVPDTQVNEETIRAQALSALATNRTFITAAKPGTAALQASAAYDQAKAQARQLNGIIRLVLGQLEAAD